MSDSISLKPAPYHSDFASVSRAGRASEGTVMLVSAGAAAAPLNRYSVLAGDPVATLTARSPRDPIELNLRGGESPSMLFWDFGEAERSALDLLEPCLESTRLPWPESNMPFTGGLVGHISYEFGSRFERMPERALESEPRPPALWLGLYPRLYLADHLRREGWLIERSVGKILRKSQPPQPRAAGPHSELIGLHSELSEPPSELDRILQSLNVAQPPSAVRHHENFKSRLDQDWRSHWSPSLDPDAYRIAVKRIRDLLARGDAYQVNLTNRFRRRFEGEPGELFASMLENNPAPFSAFLRGEGWSILSSSPELLLDLRRDGWIETRPIKGTASRLSLNVSQTIETDAESALRLLTNPKDLAEHLMIVDLERNDLGRICRPGTIHADPFMGLESCPGLHHLVSAVRGRMKPGLGPADALGALFPGGSVTGAPKVRSMEIIHELEPVPRGVYTGAIGWISPEGEARFNLAIRTMTHAEGRLDLHVGGGIVIDSDPEAEAEECRIKGAAMARAVELVLNRSSLSASATSA